MMRNIMLYIMMLHNTMSYNIMVYEEIVRMHRAAIPGLSLCRLESPTAFLRLHIESTTTSLCLLPPLHQAVAGAGSMPVKPSWAFASVVSSARR